MPRSTRTLTTAALLSVVVATPLASQTPAQAPPPMPAQSPAQASAPRPDFMVATMQAGSKHIRTMFTIAADSMSEADFAFKPTPEVRSFAQLLAHVAEANYIFCSSALGEPNPATEVGKRKTTRADVRQVMIESFDYCDRAFAAMNDEKNTRVIRPFRQTQLPALAVLNFRNYHSLLHWGNAITYMRLRGKVPPTA